MKFWKWRRDNDIPIRTFLEQKLLCIALICLDPKTQLYNLAMAMNIPLTMKELNSLSDTTIAKIRTFVIRILAETGKSEFEPIIPLFRANNKPIFNWYRKKKSSNYAHL
jgi:hypothetical protein